MLSSGKEASHKRSPVAWFHFHERSRTGKSILSKSRLLVVQGWEGGRGIGQLGSNAKGTGFLLRMMKIF